MRRCDTRSVTAVYAEDAEFFSSEDGELRLTGRDAIAENIGRVNERTSRVTRSTSSTSGHPRTTGSRGSRGGW